MEGSKYSQHNQTNNINIGNLALGKTESKRKIVSNLSKNPLQKTAFFRKHIFSGFKKSMDTLSYSLLTAWNGSRPCVPMFPIRGNKWFVIMGTTIA